MIRPDFVIHQAQVPRVVPEDGVSLREDVLFTNSSGEEKSGVKGRAIKILRNLRPALRQIMDGDEALLYVAQARSPLSAVEQLTAGWWIHVLAACVIAVTNKRILFIPVSSRGYWRESVRSVAWGDIAEIKAKGWLTRQLRFKYKNGTKEVYTGVRWSDASKLAKLAEVLLPASSGELTAHQGPVALCPDCRGVLTPGVYTCAGCGLIFKDEKTMILRSILLPGGGYFYMGHPIIGSVLAFFEILLLLDVVLVLADGFSHPEAMQGVMAAFIGLAIYWGVETTITILHCRRYIRQYIPKKRDSSRALAAAK